MAAPTEKQPRACSKRFDSKQLAFAKLQARLPAESFTVHRLLGVLPDSGEFRHNSENPLPVDLLVIDEASMLDLALTTKLFEAVPRSASIILLGDKDQLSAVESGAVFSELSADPTLNADSIDRLSALTGVRPRAYPELAAGHAVHSAEQRDLVYG